MFARQVLELAVFPSMETKAPVLLAMLVSLVGPLAVDRLCVMLFDTELHAARKAGPPMGATVSIKRSFDRNMCRLDCSARSTAGVKWPVVPAVHLLDLVFFAVLFHLFRDCCRV